MTHEIFLRDQFGQGADLQVGLRTVDPMEFSNPITFIDELPKVLKDHPGNLLSPWGDEERGLLTAGQAARRRPDSGASRMFESPQRYTIRPNRVNRESTGDPAAWRLTIHFGRIAGTPLTPAPGG